MREADPRPRYVEQVEDGGLARRVAAARRRARACDLCPHQCGVDRMAGERGRCQAGRWAVVAHHGPHHGEEGCLSGWRGSGTVFLAHCNLYCTFCQNAEISFGGQGWELQADELAVVFLDLQRQGCHNLNLVTPSPWVVPILEALEIAAARGLQIPLVYNTGGYDDVGVVNLMAEIVDIWMPDVKFLDPDSAAGLTVAPDYPEQVQRAVTAMQRAGGDLIVGSDGLARRGLLIRHLVMPGGVADSESVLAFLANLSPAAYINLMSQYRPRGDVPLELRRPVSRAEYAAVVAAARKLGLTRVEVQGW